MNDRIWVLKIRDLLEGAIYEKGLFKVWCLISNKGDRDNLLITSRQRFYWKVISKHFKFMNINGSFPTITNRTPTIITSEIIERSGKKINSKKPFIYLSISGATPSHALVKQNAKWKRSDAEFDVVKLTSPPAERSWDHCSWFLAFSHSELAVGWIAGIFVRK